MRYIQSAENLQFRLSVVLWAEDQRPYITIRINDKLKVAPVASAPEVAMRFPVKAFVQIAWGETTQNIAKHDSESDWSDSFVGSNYQRHESKLHSLLLEPLF